ncbi:MAG: CopG family transcriptional regulator [Candidatus Marinimicrobia bacterium]|nr:CopG family transcriptional regulator [Candidatus Neomarinimicrobiota bacterium]
MSKTVTIRLDEDVYQTIKSAAQAEKRTISNLMTYATVSYLESSSFVSDEEMREIAEDKDLIHRLQIALKDVEQGHTRPVE